MPVIEVTLSIKQDGVEVFGQPLRRRVELAEGTGAFAYTQASGSSYVAMPPSQLAELDFLVIRPNQVSSVRLNNQSDAGITLNAQGLLLLIDCVLNSGTATNAKVQTNSGSTTTIRGILGGP